VPRQEIDESTERRPTQVAADIDAGKVVYAYSDPPAPA